MSAPVRKKRNFKGLGLDVAQPVAAPAPPPITFPVTLPGAPAKKRPPPMTLKAPKLASSSVTAASIPENEELQLSTALPPNSAPATASPINVNAKRMTYHTALSHTLASLELNAEKKFELRNNDDLKDLHELGQGNGGSVKKVEHVPTGTHMAKKIVLIDAKPSVRKQILRELQIMHDCNSPYIISFYGAFLADPNICICMEFADKGSLDGIYKKIGPIDIEVVGQVAIAVLEGLTYLYDVHRIIHRDIKPSNILFNSKGQVKICDFGVSGELINSIADTFRRYINIYEPERIQGAQYTVKSDVWSMGISLIELALGRFPFSNDAFSDDSDLSDLEGTLSPSNVAPHMALPLPGQGPRPRPTPEEREARRKRDKRKSKGVSLQGGGMTMSILELLQHIVNEPAPRLVPEDRFPAESEEFVDMCLLKDPEARWTPKQLLAHPWIVHSRTSTFDLEEWASTF